MEESEGTSLNGYEMASLGDSKPMESNSSEEFGYLDSRVLVMAPIPETEDEFRPSLALQQVFSASEIVPSAKAKMRPFKVTRTLSH